MDETDALAKRVAEARDRVAQRGATAELNALERAVANSKAVMNRHLAPLHTWLRSNNPLFRNYYYEVDAGRVPTNDTFNRQRASAENTVNPGFFEELSVAALTIDGRGTIYYGAYSVVLKEAHIAQRATVFEENPFYFHERHAVISGHDAPAGHRAIWWSRGELAIAKLHPRVAKGMQTSDLANIVMGANRNEPNCDFIEVHIYDAIHRSSIERVAGPAPSDPVDQMFWEDSKRLLAELGAEVEEV